MGVYRKEFIDKVKRVYTGCTSLIEAAESGNAFLGRYLDDNSEGGITSEDVLKLPEKELKKKALHLQRKKELYHEWYSGKAFTQEGIQERYCPLSYAQSANYNIKSDVECAVCGKRGAKYVCFFPSCKFWNDKNGCWKLYKQLWKL